MCHHCGDIGHTVDNCKLKNNTNQINTACNYCGDITHQLDECHILNDEDPQFEDDPIALNVTNSSHSINQHNSKCTLHDHLWIADSGASCHMTGTPNLVHDIKPYQSDEQVTTANG